MSYYVWGSKKSYADYLTDKSFVDDIASIAKDASRRVSLEISHKTRELVASNAALSRENIRTIEASTSQIAGVLSDGFDGLSYDLSSGFDRLSYDLQDVSAGISELKSTFHWGFGELVAGIGRMNDSLSELIKTAKTPAQTAAYEHYEIARDAFRQGLYPECLESLEKAINGDHISPGYKLDWRFHQMKGVLYLGFEGCDLSNIDLEKAEATFLLAMRYARKDYPEQAAQALLSAGWAAYCQGKMKEAIAYTEEALTLHP